MKKPQTYVPPNWWHFNDLWNKVNEIIKWINLYESKHGKLTDEDPQ